MSIRTSKKRSAFPTTRQLMLLVAYSAGLCALLVPLARRHNVADFSLLAILLVLGVPSLLNLVIWLAEKPGEQRQRHLLLGVVLARISKALATLAVCAAIWFVDWSDFAFFIRVEGRRWLVNWVAAPLWVVALCRWLLALWRRRSVNDRVRQLLLATLFLVAAIGYREIAPILLDRDLVNVSRGLLTLILLGAVFRMLPGRCPGCSRRTMIRLPCRPPFVAHTTTPYTVRQCLACEEQYRDPQPSNV